MYDDNFLKAIRAGTRRFYARFARRDNAEGTGPEWSAPEWVTLYVALREKPMRDHPKGEILTLTPEGKEWAEYGESDYCGEGEFLCEEYRMQLMEEQP